MSPDELVLRQNRAALAVLGDWYSNERSRESWADLPLELFPNPKLRSIANAANTGVSPDELELSLARNGAANLWPHPGDAVEMLLSAVAPLDFQAAVHELRTVHETMRLRDALHRSLQALGTDKLEDVVEKLQEAQADAQSKLAPGFTYLTEAEWMAPLPPRNWLCKDLLMTVPEEPVFFFGPPGRGKSWIAIELAVAVATGTPFAGIMEVRRGVVNYYDLEQGDYTMKERLQQLMGGRHLTTTEGRLRPCILPLLNLGDPKIEAQLIRECQGVNLSILDSFSASHNIDENTVAVGNLLVMLHRVSRATGCAFAIVHHSRKKPNDPDAEERDVTLDDLRGSGNIPSHTSTVWAFQGKIWGPDRGELHLLKTRVGPEPPKYSLKLHPASAEGTDGVLVAEPLEKTDGETATRKIEMMSLDEVCTLVLEFIRRKPGCSTTRVLEETGVKGKRIGRAALERLQDDGVIATGGQRGRGGSKFWTATEAVAQRDFSDLD